MFLPDTSELLSSTSTRRDTSLRFFEDNLHSHSPSASRLRPDAVYAKVLREHGLRKRRCWTQAEDDALRKAVRLEHPDGRPPSRWLEIAKHVPGRTNKDCRKRWHNHMSGPQTLKGGWSAEEDALLINAVKLHGTKWPAVAAMVGTRKSCQCARRWYDTLDPTIDKAPWTREEDAQLAAAVSKHGKKWSHISKTYFPRRTGLAAKNRFFALVTSSMRKLNDETASHTDEIDSWVRHDPRAFYDDQPRTSPSAVNALPSTITPSELFTYNKNEIYNPLNSPTSSLSSSPTLSTPSPSTPLLHTPLHEDEFSFAGASYIDGTFKDFDFDLRQSTGDSTSTSSLSSLMLSTPAFSYGLDGPVSTMTRDSGPWDSGFSIPVN